MSWAAIFAGAAGAAALSLVLVILGVGLGLSSVSPWHNSGTAGMVGTAAIVWLAFTQLAAAGLGGYLAGRLRTKWVGVHTDETYFRDTAHGFMAWAVASIVTFTFLGAAVSGMLGTATNAGALASAASNDSAGADRLSYFSNAMFRKDAAHLATPTSPDTRKEALGIFTADVAAGKLPDADRQYLGSVVAQETGVAQPEAEKRVSDKFNEALTTIDAARKAAAHTSLWMFVALMIGAFFASLAATFGGRRRDDMN